MLLDPDAPAHMAREPDQGGGMQGSCLGDPCGTFAQWVPRRCDCLGELESLSGCSGPGPIAVSSRALTCLQVGKELERGRVHSGSPGS